MLTSCALIDIFNLVFNLNGVFPQVRITTGTEKGLKGRVVEIKGIHWHRAGNQASLPFRDDAEVLYVIAFSTKATVFYTSGCQIISSHPIHLPDNVYVIRANPEYGLTTLLHCTPDSLSKYFQEGVWLFFCVPPARYNLDCDEWEQRNPHTQVNPQVFIWAAAVGPPGSTREC